MRFDSGLTSSFNVDIHKHFSEKLNLMEEIDFLEKISKYGENMNLNLIDIPSLEILDKYNFNATLEIDEIPVFKFDKQWETNTNVTGISNGDICHNNIIDIKVENDITIAYYVYPVWNVKIKDKSIKNKHLKNNTKKLALNTNFPNYLSKIFNDLLSKCYSVVNYMIFRKLQTSGRLNSFNCKETEREIFLFSKISRRKWQMVTTHGKIDKNYVTYLNKLIREHFSGKKLNNIFINLFYFNSEQFLLINLPKYKITPK